jgi:transketolase
LKRISDARELKLIANAIRQDIIRSLTEAGSGHSAGPLGMTDVFTVLYFNILNHNPNDPNWEGRDYLILSNGHICPVLYATMANAGYFPKEELMTLRKLSTRLQGHPHRAALPGLETSSGPLGSGLSQAAGMAYGLKMDGKQNLVYCLTGDGEHDEGNLWEAVMFAGKYQLDNFIAVVDRNYIQIDGNTEDVMPLNPTKDKYLAFNWEVIEINGNDIEQIITAMNTAKLIIEKPTMIIANNIPGKGVSFMENDYQWHGKPPTPEQAEIALAELLHERRQLQRIRAND